MDKVLLGSDADQPSGQGKMLVPINNISLQMQEHMMNIEKKCSEFGDAISFISYHGNFRLRVNGNRYHGNRYNNSSSTNTDNRNEQNQGGNSRNVVPCFQCNGLNHLARNCLLRAGSGNV